MRMGPSKNVEFSIGTKGAMDILMEIRETQKVGHLNSTGQLWVIFFRNVRAHMNYVHICILANFWV